MKYIIEDESYNQKNNVLEIEKGHTVFLVGPNSVGKSTLLKALQFSPHVKTIISAKTTIILTKEVLLKTLVWEIGEIHSSIIEQVIESFKDIKITLHSKTEEFENEQFDFINDYLSEIEKISKKNSNDEITSIRKELLDIQEKFILILDMAIEKFRVDKTKKFESLKEEEFDIECYKQRYCEEKVNNPLYKIFMKIKRCTSYKERVNNVFDKFDPYNLNIWSNQKIYINNSAESDSYHEFLRQGEIVIIEDLITKRDELIDRAKRTKTFVVKEHSFHRIAGSFNSELNISFYLDKPGRYKEIVKVSDINSDIARIVEKDLKIVLIQDEDYKEKKFHHALNSLREQVFDLSDGQIKQIENIKMDQENRVVNQSWDEPFVSLDHDNVKIRRNAIMKNGKTNLVATHNFASIFPAKPDDVYILYVDDKKKRNLMKLIDVFNHKSLPTSIKKIVPRLLHELFSSHPKNLIVEGKDDMLMIKKLYEMLGRKCKINFVPLNGVEKLK
ncbi:MAG: ATP-binding cassette domain-containing protein, partial [Mycoplasmataceae bacterium]|nr:ATP-binding cassette domain-containing protein [Mycoplasmataceae bacterium]